MPNWVFNSVVIDGDKISLKEIQEQLNKPVTKHFPEMKFNKETNEWESTPDTQHYSNPVFSFWNVIAPTDLKAYYGEEKEKIELDNFMEGFNNAMAKDPSWYWWNNRNWGTKWDICVRDDEQYPDTRLEVNDDGSLMYHFQTAWSPVPEIFNKLADEYPTLTFDYEYEEEQGWGGSMFWEDGILKNEEQYDIPSSHADYEERGRECNCETEPDYPEYWYQDCPVDKERFELVDDEWKEKESV